MTVKQIFSFSADLIAVALMIWQLVKLSKVQGEEDLIKLYFKRLCIVTLLIAAVNFLKVYADIQLGTLTVQGFGRFFESDKPMWYLTEIIAWFAAIFLTTVFLYMWIKFLCWYLFNDKDFIERKFWLGFSPLILSAVDLAFSVQRALVSKQGLRAFIFGLCVFYVIRFVYFLFSLWLLNEYKKQNGYLRFFNPWTFFIPVFAGWILQDIFSLEFAALGSALGIVLIYASVVEEKQYVDSKTGFYKRKFADYLRELTDKNQYNPCSAIIFTLNSPKDMKSFASVLKEQLPENCEPILKNDDNIVVLTGVSERTALQMVIVDVTDVVDVKATCTLKKKKETPKEFMERVL